MREAIQDLIPGANFISRPRLSQLTYAGEKKITRLPGRSAVVAFSANEVYAIAELIRRQRGGTAVVLGALSPRTRNAQVALYQSGDVDFLVATDAIGMGLNLDVDHVAFSAMRKFDGQNFRNLTRQRDRPDRRPRRPSHERRHLRRHRQLPSPSTPISSSASRPTPSTACASCSGATAVSTSRSLDRLRDSLREMPNEQRLTRARMADDVVALETVVERSARSRPTPRSPAAVQRLWEVCQIPDYRKISSQNHAELCATSTRLPHEPRRPRARGLVRQAGRVRRSHRWRHRHARQPHRPHPHLDVRFEPRRLAEGPGPLAGAHARHRGQRCRTRCTSS